MCALGHWFEGYADQLQVVINRICTTLHSCSFNHIISTGIDIPAVEPSCIEKSCLYHSLSLCPRDEDKMMICDAC